MSSTTPLQSSSMPLHVSVTGEPGTTPHAVPLLSDRHVNVPVRAHAPTPTEQLEPSAPPNQLLIAAAVSRTCR